MSYENFMEIKSPFAVSQKSETACKECENGLVQLIKIGK